MSLNKISVNNQDIIGIDNIPTLGSENLITSDGVISYFNTDNNILNLAVNPGFVLKANYTFESGKGGDIIDDFWPENYRYSDVIHVSKNDVINYNLINGRICAVIAMYSASDGTNASFISSIDGDGPVNINGSYTFEYDCYIRISYEVEYANKCRCYLIRNSKEKNTVTNVPILGTLNAKLLLDENGILFVCNYSNSTVSKYSTVNGAYPSMLGYFKCGTSPRDCLKIDNYLFVCCHDGGCIRVYDITNIEDTYTEDNYILSLSMSRPKQLIYVDNALYVAGGSGSIVKYKINSLYPLNVTKEKEISTNGMMLCVSYNGYGLFCCTGLTDTIYFFDKDLNYHTVVLEENSYYPFILFYKSYLFMANNGDNQYGIVVAQHLSGNNAQLLNKLDLGSYKPEQIYIKDNKLYTVTTSVPSYLLTIDISNPLNMGISDITSLSGEVAGFIASSNEYVYITHHQATFLECVKIK